MDGSPASGETRNGFAMVIGTLVIRLVIRESHSLKQKRSILKGVKDRLRNQFNVSVSEIEAHDVWQSAMLGVAMVGCDKRYVNGALCKVVDFIRGVPQVQLVDYELEFY